MGPRSAAIQAAPAGVATTDAEKLLTEILDGPIAKTPHLIETLQAKIAPPRVPPPPIKVNTPLDHTKMEWLLDALAKTDCR